MLIKSNDLSRHEYTLFRVANQPIGEFAQHPKQAINPYYNVFPSKQ